MAKLRGSVTGYRKTGSSTTASRLASESITAQVNSWGVNLRIWLNAEGKWVFTVENYTTGAELFRVSGDESGVEGAEELKRALSALETAVLG